MENVNIHKQTIPNGATLRLFGSVLDRNSVFILIELGLIVYSTNGFEFFSNFFTKAEGKKKWRVQRYFFLHLTNYGYILTTFVILARIMGIWLENWRAYYIRLLPITFTIEMAITVIFWVLFVMNKSLIINSDRGVKRWYKHLLDESPKHLAPFLILLIEAMVFDFPKMETCDAWALLGFMTIYWIINEIYTYKSGNYAYSILKKLKAPLRPLLFVGIMGIFILVYFLIRQMIIGEVLV